MSSVPPDDLVARGRAVFDLLRNREDDDPTQDHDVDEASEGEDAADAEPGRPTGDELVPERDHADDRPDDGDAESPVAGGYRLGPLPDSIPEEAPPVERAPPPSEPAATGPDQREVQDEEPAAWEARVAPPALPSSEPPPAAGQVGAPPALQWREATGESRGDEATSDSFEEAPPPEPEPEPEPASPPSTFARPLPRVLAVANQKGGVGKTTTAVNLGACLADLGYRVLVVDLDPQGNASTGLGINIRALQSSMYDVILHEAAMEDCIEASSVRNLFVAPASLDLAGAEVELVPAFSRELKLRRALEQVRDDYDFVLIDCPPSLGLLTVNGLASADEVLVPIQCEYYALEGLGQLMRNVTLVQKNLNPTLELSAIVLVMYDARTKLSDQVVQEVRDHFGDKVCRTVIPRTVRLSEAPSFGQPIIAFDSSSRGAIAYRELAKEVSGGTPQRAG